MNLFNLFAKISLDSSEYDKGIMNATRSGESLGAKIKSAGAMAVKGFTAVAGAAGIVGGALLAAEAASEEYRISQGKLTTAFEAAGYSAETAQQAYTGFYGILGDVDTATEASQLLAKLALNEEDVATWTNIAAGVFGTFGDSLPIEGLIESANETAKVGVVTGVLADALNWAGISEEEFNMRLAECSTEEERNKLIMDTLNGTYSDASDIFYENNEELVKARENQDRLNKVLATVGAAVTKVKNAFLSELTPALVNVSEKAANFIENIDVEKVVERVKMLINVFIQLSPIMAAAAAATLAYKAAVTISSIITAVTNATKGMTIAQAALNAVMAMNPFVLVATLIAAVGTALVTLYLTNEDFRNKVQEIWGSITGVFSSAWESIKSVWDQVQPYFMAIWSAIKTTFSVAGSVIGGYFQAAWLAVKIVWDVVSGYFQNVWNTIAGIFAVVEAVLSGDFRGAWDAIKSVFSGWKSYFTGLWDTVKSVFSGAYTAFSEIGKNIVRGIWDGIKSMTGWLYDNVIGFINGFKALFTGKSGFDTHSPSKWSQGIFEYVMQGGVAGMESGAPSLYNEVESVVSRVKDGMSFGVTPVDFSESGVGVASAGIINGMYSSKSDSGSIYTINLMLPDGSKLAKYVFKPLTDYAAANGTPILYPSR